MPKNESEEEPKPTEPQRMKGFDFATWRTYTEDPVMRSTIIGLLVLEASPDWDTLVSRFERVSRTVPALREKVIDPGGFATPRTVIDDDFDLGFHLRQFRMPVDATWDDVLEDARRQSMTDFDRDRPLWRFTLLNGLPGGKAAIILKVHHALMDGEGIVMLGASLFDFTPEPANLGPMPPAPVGQTLGRRGFAEIEVKDNVSKVAQTARDLITGFVPATIAAVKDPQETAVQFAKTAISLVKFIQVPLGPLSPIMTKRSINYHFSTFEMPFSQIRDAGKSVSHTANDVFLAGVSEGMAMYHTQKGHPVDKLRVNIPVSTRKPGGGTDMAVNVARFDMPIDSQDTLGLMDQLGAIVAGIRKDPAIGYANQLGEFARFIPKEVVVTAAQASDITASNVPGLPVPVWLAGAKIERMYPLVATVGAAVNLTMLTYDGTATFGVSTDEAAVPDYRELLAALRAGFAHAVGQPVPDRNPIDGEIPDSAAVKKAPAKKAAAEKAPAKEAEAPAAEPKPTAAAEVEQSEQVPAAD